MTRKRRSPSVGTGAAPKHRANGYADSSLHRAEDGYVAPSVEDRAVQAAIEVLHGYGYGMG